MSWFGLFDDVKQLASEAILDKDKAKALDTKLDELRERVYIEELHTKTVPWVDALHKLARPIMSLTMIITVGVVISLNPDIDIVKLLSGGAPAMLYTAMKGKGR